MALLVKKLVPEAYIPLRAHSGDAGYDIKSVEDVVLYCHTRSLVKTGIAVAIPDEHYGRIAPRSSLACKGIDIGAGVIDGTFRGEIRVLVINNSKNDYKISKGDKIAQLILERISTPRVVECDELPKSERGSGGFGSTGK